MTLDEDHTLARAWARPVFRVASLEASIAYYRDCLGFDVDWVDGSTTPPACAQVSRAHVAIILDERAAFPKAAVPGVLSVSLDDSPESPRLDELHRDLAQSGGRMVRSPFRVPWHEQLRQLDVEDLDGNVLMFWGHGRPAAEP